MTFSKEFAKTAFVESRKQVIEKQTKDIASLRLADKISIHKTRKDAQLWMED